MCTPGQDPGFHTTCQRVFNPGPCWGAVMVLLGDCGQGKKKKTPTNPNKPANKTTWLVFSTSETHTSCRQKLLGITFPNHLKMPAHPFLLVAMVRDDGAPDGYNTRQRAGKGFSRGRREASGGKRGRRCPPVATLLTSTDGPPRTCRGGKRLPAALGGLSDGRVCCSALHVRMVKTVVKVSCFLSE